MIAEGQRPDSAPSVLPGRGGREGSLQSAFILNRRILGWLGIAALPDFLTDVPIAEGTLRQVMADYPSPEAGIYVVRPPGGIAPRKVRALIDILIERFGAR
ncbi:LysR substrate-binding domain-containing protein [Mesorhizobium sp.]|uniref:LysR substrate-binding domain-containing protein n=1 Tax=Mesorhizobium sp. TaxID=1871066 RepID=UPI00257DB3EB|nr:LysR substrate-binding domain-containing protein [Mesorhizobium sp.]